jgi:hypothetical protein
VNWGNRTIAAISIAVAAMLPLASSAQTPATMMNMRAVHFTGNEGFNIAGIKDVPQEYWDFLDRNHVNWVGIYVAMFQNSISDPMVRIRYRPAGMDDATVSQSGFIYTFEDADLLGFIAQLRAHGIHPYLGIAFETPLNVNASASTGCGTSQYYAPRWAFGEPVVPQALASCVDASSWWWSPSHPAYAANLATFWSTYSDVAVKYATLAQQSGVELFSLGTETEGLFRTRTGPRYSNQFLPQLQAMVAKVRQVYHGLVTYDQVSDVEQVASAYQEQATLFSDLGLDVVGISAYFRLASSPPAAPMSVADLQSSWHSIFQTQLRPLQARNPGKPILFLEFGYTDTVHAPADPTADEYQPFAFMDSNGNGIDDGFEQQANVFDAFYRENAANSNLVGGTFIHDAGINGLHFVTNNRVFSIYQKPAELVVGSAYAQYLSVATGALSGLWWNPNESGWGISLTQRRNTVFGAWYTYDASGKPKWYVASNCALPAGTNGTNGTCTGSLYQVTGPTFFGASFNPALENVAAVGTLSIAFQDANTATMSYTVNGQTRTVPIGRQVFASGTTPPAIDYTDLWWNSAESGWGMSITQQYGVMFLAWYVYDASGNPVWYVASNCVVQGVGCSGSVYSTTGPPFGATFDPAQVHVSTVGTITASFTDASSATITYTVNGVTSTKQIARQIF